ncbi:MAG: hypothetical protein WKF77_27970 [Planctomycetaceae bacterium]
MNPMKKSKPNVTLRTWLSIQLVFSGAFAASWFLLPVSQRQEVIAHISHKPYQLDVVPTSEKATTVESLYDDAEVVSDEELAAVLKKILPRFSRDHLRPNLVEHALRTWGSEIEFANPDIISGPQMKEFLTDMAKFVDSWGKNATPLMVANDDGIHVRYAEDRSGSVHHDHTLAALTEAGLSLDDSVFTTARKMHVRNILIEALRDFQLDERETEWSVMSFALWLAPQKSTTWHNGEGRQITFDMLAERLMRNHKRDGVCLGTHRVYSLMLLVRLDDQNGGKLITTETRGQIMEYLMSVRDLIAASQRPDGSWTSNWTDGAESEAKADLSAPLSKRVIATGHHLEWLSIAPIELHPPREQILKAADWLVANVEKTPQDEVDTNYTFYSHVGKALAMWRHTSPASFWTQWRTSHPDCEVFEMSLKKSDAVRPAATDAAH